MDRFASVRSDKQPIDRAILSELVARRLPSYADYYLPNDLGIAFDDSDVGILARLSGLEIVGLENARISDRALEFLSHLSSLRLLDIDGTAITDSGVISLANHPRLEVLWMEECAISDACIPALLTCTRLGFVSLTYTEVSQAGMQRLEERGIEVLA
ncbi:MAG: hypothetical protein JRI25_02645 [Deltaproteobacteria bacterium]|nr:hypothetical protein [Deltaproteobacteria bacterium]